MGLSHAWCHESHYKAQRKEDIVKMGHRVGLPTRVWSSELPNRRLIVIVGVEVGEICVGIGLPGKLWIEVLISFLQNQIVLIEGL